MLEDIGRGVTFCEIFTLITLANKQAIAMEVLEAS
jgi:hypothetical protein